MKRRRECTKENQLQTDSHCVCESVSKSWRQESVSSWWYPFLSHGASGKTTGQTKGPNLAKAARSNSSRYFGWAMDCKRRQAYNSQPINKKKEHESGAVKDRRNQTRANNSSLSESTYNKCSSSLSQRFAQEIDHPIFSTNKMSGSASHNNTSCETENDQKPRDDHNSKRRRKNLLDEEWKEFVNDHLLWWMEEQEWTCHQKKENFHERNPAHLIRFDKRRKSMQKKTKQTRCERRH